MRTKIFILSILCLLISTINLDAQREKNRPGDYLQVEMADGSVYKGDFVSESDTQLVLDVLGVGETKIERRFIKKIEKMDERFRSNGDGFTYENPLYSQYYVSQSALSLRKGEAYYQNIELFVNTFAYGITDNFTLSGGFETISIFVGEFPGLYISPKYTFGNTESILNFGIGANLATYQFDEIFGSTYGMMTIGNTNDNLTLGVGFGFFGDNFEETPVFNVSGMTRFGQKIGMVADIFYASEETIGAITLRYMNKSFAFDLGAAFGGGSAFPLVSSTIKF